MWVAAHGIMIVTPVNWYQVTSPLKLMMDRLVCADGGNPDPTRTHGKDATMAKADRARGLGLSPASGRAAVLRRRARRRGGRGERAPLDLRLALLHASLPGRTERRARPLHRLLEALCDEPRRARRRHGMQEEVRNAARTLVEGVDGKRYRPDGHGGGKPVRASAEVGGAPDRSHAPSEPFAAVRLFPHVGSSSARRGDAPTEEKRHGKKIFAQRIARRQKRHAAA